MAKSRLRLLGLDIKVREVPVGADQPYATWNYSDLKLAVQKGMNTQVEENVILHECLHAISDMIGLKLTERQVEGLEAGLSSLLRDNGGSLEFLRRK